MTRNYFHDRLDVLGARKRDLDAPVDIKYMRGSRVHSVPLVSIGKTMVEEVYPGVDILIKETRDYIFDFSEMEDQFGEPKPGDRIQEDQTGLVCEVVAVGGDHCYRWTTATRKRIRIHTQIMRQYGSGKLI